MKLHIITIGQPKLAYAKTGWQEYWRRLSHYHQLRATHISDKHNDAGHILAAAGSSYKVILEINGKQQNSQDLADWLAKRALDGREMSIIIGGPDGLSAAVKDAADWQWSLGAQTLPHDLAMVVTLEALYRASTIGAGQPYHR